MFTRDLMELPAAQHVTPISSVESGMPVRRPCGRCPAIAQRVTANRARAARRYLGVSRGVMTSISNVNPCREPDTMPNDPRTAAPPE